MNTATHPVTPEQVMAFLDGELSSVQAQSVFEHVKHCADCASLAAELGDTQRQLAAWRVDALPLRVESALLEKLERQSAPSRDAGRWPSRAGAPIGARPLLAVSGAAAALVIVFLFARVSGRSYFATYLEPRPTSPSIATLGAGGGIAPREISDKSKALAEYEALLREKQPLATSSSLDLEPASESVGRGEGAGNGQSDEDGHVTPDFHQPMIARTVSLTILTKDFPASRAQLDAILARYHGYAAQLAANNAENTARSITASLRIPASELPVAINALKNLGHVETESQSGEEVTQQHADLIARLKNAHETETRLQAILQQRTGKVADVLAVEQEIARVRGEIEQMEAERKALEHRVDFSSIELSLTEEYKAQLDGSSPSVSTRMHNALVDGFEHAAESLLSLLVFFMEAGPILLLWGAVLFLPAFFVIRRYRRAVTAV
jgi:hypothetical protein